MATTIGTNLCQPPGARVTLSTCDLLQPPGLPKAVCIGRSRRLSVAAQYPESSLWEHQSGYQWLHRLVWAVVYVFGVKRRIGNETLSEFFHLVHLHERIGVSPNALQRIRVQMEAQVLHYRDEQQADLEQSGLKVEVCGGFAFFEQMVLVLLDLPSGYIFVESQSASRDYQTCLERVQQAVGSIAQVKYLVSDRAKALVKLALEEWH